MKGDIRMHHRLYLTLWALLFAALLLLTVVRAAAEEIGIALDFQSERNRLSGSLFLPDSQHFGVGPYPAAVFIVGSGTGSYRASWEGEPRWYLYSGLQQYFNARGIAFFVYDKPGIARSTGDWRKQSLHQRAAEAMAAVTLLAGRPDIDGSRIGLIGHSQGGWAALIAAADHPEEVAHVILMAGPAISVRQQVREETRDRWACRDAAFAGLRAAGLDLGISALQLSSAVVPTGFLSRLINFRPKSYLRRIEQPVLALYGTNDWMVSPDTSIPPLQREFGRDSGNTALFIEVIEGANHWFGERGGCPGEARGNSFLPAFLKALDAPAYWEKVANRGEGNE
jgi:uncharacterized protein